MTFAKQTAVLYLPLITMSVTSLLKAFAGNLSLFPACTGPIARAALQ